jgi:hypothetical protein
MTRFNIANSLAPRRGTCTSTSLAAPQMVVAVRGSKRCASRRRARKVRSYPAISAWHAPSQRARRWMIDSAVRFRAITGDSGVDSADLRANVRTELWEPRWRRSRAPNRRPERRGFEV